MNNTDPDVATYLRLASAHIDINALGPDWENSYVAAIEKLKSAAIKASFRRGFAKAMLGQLSAREYERATGWNFDTEQEFREHLRHFWRLFYGSDEPADSA